MIDYIKAFIVMSLLSMAGLFISSHHFSPPNTTSALSSIIILGVAVPYLLKKTALSLITLHVELGLMFWVLSLVILVCFGVQS